VGHDAADDQRVLQPVRNEIVFPAAILQPPFFNLERDDAVNYGGIGAVIGTRWGTASTIRAAASTPPGAARLVDQGRRSRISEARQGAVDQFNEFEPLPGLQVNGELTLGENLADLTGLVIRSQAYQLSLKGKLRRRSTASPPISASTWDGRSRGRRRSATSHCGQQVLTTCIRRRCTGPTVRFEIFRSSTRRFGVKEGDKHYLLPIAASRSGKTVAGTCY
jgi:predicted metalloendopeptidase